MYAGKPLARSSSSTKRERERESEREGENNNILRIVTGNGKGQEILIKSH